MAGLFILFVVCIYLANLQPLLVHKKLMLGRGSSSVSEKDDCSDGLNEVEASSVLRFPEDNRFHEVCRMLRSSQPIYLKLERGGEASEPEYRQKLQTRLYMLCRRYVCMCTSMHTGGRHCTVFSLGFCLFYGDEILYYYYLRTFATPVGRGMITIASIEPLMAEMLPIPPLSQSGSVPPNNSIIALEVGSGQADMLIWPEFHNGAAAALRVGPRGSFQQQGIRKVTRNWIMYSKTASLAKPNGENAHAGFLLGLGLFGHLNVITITDICDYLTQGHEPTIIAILIGVAASKMGSIDALFSKTLCLHLSSLLPAQHWDIDIAPIVQCASLVGLGFLYCRSANRLMIQFLLEELARKPSSERCECRESLALSAAWALAMILLPDIPAASSSAAPKSTVLSDHKDESAPGTSAAYENSFLKDLADLKIEDRLFLLISGGKRPVESTLFPNHSNGDPAAKSSRILESDNINVDVTLPGATLALGLLYMRTNNNEILRRLEFPTTAFELDAIRPDHLIFRALARCLVLWESLSPTASWIEAQFPPVLAAALSGNPSNPTGLRNKSKYSGPYGNARKSLHDLAPGSSFGLVVNAIAGYCLGIGVVFAGTFNAAARGLLLEKLRWIQR